YFFQPVELVRIDTGKSATVVDGGMLSNFPVWLFDVEDRDPKRPTFGFRLIGGKGVGGGMQAVVNGLGWPVKLGADMFHTAKETAQGERRVALVPDAVSRLSGFEVVVESGAGAQAGFTDEAFVEAGAVLGDPWGADAVVKVAKPSVEETARLGDGTVLIAFLQ